MTASPIEIWTAFTGSAPESSWPALAALLDDAEQERARHFRFARHQRSFVAAHALKRLMLSSIAGVPPAAWRFGNAEHGKPRILAPAASSLRFNISHCEGLVACVVSPDREVGVDVEWLGRPAPLDVASTHFAAPENRWLAGLPPAQRSRGFLRLWTLKEAWLKGTGLGLSVPLQNFAFSMDPPRLHGLDPSLAQHHGWCFMEKTLEGDFQLAAAWQDVAPLPAVIDRHVSLAALL